MGRIGFMGSVKSMILSKILIMILGYDFGGVMIHD